MQSGDIGNRAERNEVEQGEKVRFLARREIIPAAQFANQRDGKQEGDPDRSQMPVRRTFIAFVEAVGIDQRCRDRKIGRTFVMVDNDHVHASLARGGKCVMGHRTAIHGHDEAAALFGNAHQRLSAGAVAFQQAVGDIMRSVDAEIAQQADQQRGTRRAVDVVVAIDGDRFAADDSLGDSLRSLVHVAEHRRIRQESAQSRVALPVEIAAFNPAGEQQLRDDVVHRQRRTVVHRHVAFAPAPGPSGQRAFDTADGAGYGVCHDVSDT